MLLHINENIIVPSRWLDSKLKQHILDDLKTKKDRTFSKVHGYIKTVVKVNKIHSAYIAFADSSNRFNIEYIIDVIKPAPGVKYTGKIIGIYDQGIFVDVDGFQTLVIVNSKYLNIEQKKINLPCCPQMKIGDSIDLSMVEVEFKCNQLSCIGKHEHD
jgi:DNA-directed RNA polymerase subunit E'/Rpb7